MLAATSTIDWYNAQIIGAIITAAAAIIAAAVAAWFLVWQGKKALAHHREKEAFRVMQETRARALGEVYAHLSHAHSAFFSKGAITHFLVQGGRTSLPTPEELNTESLKQLASLQACVDASAPYIPNELLVKVASFVITLTDLFASSEELFLESGLVVPYDERPEAKKASPHADRLLKGILLDIRSILKIPDKLGSVG